MKELITNLIKNGYKQVSRRYRTVAALPSGMTGLEALATVDPGLAEHLLKMANESAADQYRRCHADKNGNSIQLSIEEFSEFLKQTKWGL